MEVFVSKSKKRVIELCVKKLLEKIKKNPSITVGLSTGRTMIPFYSTLITLLKKERIDLSRIKTFNVDEYYGIKSSDKRCLRYFMNKHLFSKCNIKKENIHFLDSCPDNVKKECIHFENKIKKFGGIDILILGIGRNAHIGFNEPGSSLLSKTRKVSLSTQTLSVNFPRDYGKKIKYALTMGIKTIRQAKAIFLIGWGKEKAFAIKKTIESKPTRKFPSTFLKNHSSFFIFSDNLSFSKVNLKKIKKIPINEI